ncbi:MAG TPA: DNA-binding protein [Microscillaceae bacterium]|jgi:DNA-binding YbaB/EbfC family protein|nr:DNA-binding protein [Microscillaceae bacterium]
MFDINSLLGKAKEIQEKMREAQESLVHVKATAESGAGMVKATVNGKKQVLQIDIDPTFFKPEDREMLQDLIAAAINKAMEEVEEKSKEELKKITQNFMPNIPGLDLNNLF